MTDLSRKTVSSGFIWKLLERLGAQGISLIVSIILARLLDPSVYGTIALVTVFTTILQVFVDGGLASALIQKKNVDNIDYSSVFYFNLLFGLFLYGIMFFAAPFIADFYGYSELVPLVRVLSLMIIISSVKNVQHAYIARNLLFKRFFWATLGGTVIAGVVSIIMAYNGFGVWSLVASHLVNMFIDTVILWITVEWKPQFVFSSKRLKSLLSYGWKLLCARMIETFYTECRALIIGKMYSSSDLAFYNRGRQYPNLIVKNVDYSVSSVLFPVMSKVQDDVEKCRSIVRRAITLNTYIIAPSMMGLAVCAEPFVRLVLTEKWMPCVPYLRIFCFTLAFVTFNTANMNSYRSIGRSDIYLKIEIIRKTMGIIILIVSMWFGVFWIAMGEVVATIIAMIVTAHPNHRFLGYGFLKQLKDVLPCLVLTVIMGIATYPISLLGLPDALTLVIQIIVGVFVYVAGSVVMHIESLHYCKSLILSFIKKK